mmetsp:Transcript_37571/g.117413  ORF Transcript_37571/g.117413 Transcript_37571/m.117413 type:complete len:206 (+) Transcript_37571:1099-1716(+)
MPARPTFLSQTPQRFFFFFFGVIAGPSDPRFASERAAAAGSGLVAGAAGAGAATGCDGAGAGTALLSSSTTAGAGTTGAATCTSTGAVGAAAGAAAATGAGVEGVIFSVSARLRESSSRQHFEHMFPVSALPKKPHPPAHSPGCACSCRSILLLLESLSSVGSKMKSVEVAVSESAWRTGASVRKLEERGREDWGLGAKRLCRVR